MIMLLSVRRRLEYLVFQIGICVVDCLSPRATAHLAEHLAALQASEAHHADRWLSDRTMQPVPTAPSRLGRMATV